MPVADSERFARAIAAIDAGNADDPNVVTDRDRGRGPKEILHAELVTEWVAAAPPGRERAAAARRARSSLSGAGPSRARRRPPGRAGYLRWRKSLQEQHARELGALLADAGYDADTVARVQAIVRKEGLAHDAEVQVLEDALCLVFLETQLADVVARLDPDTLDRACSCAPRSKMSEAGRAAIADVPLDEHASTILAAARSPATSSSATSPGCAAHDWGAVAETLAPDVERMGPYRDAYRGREQYADVPGRHDRRARRLPARRRPRARGAARW